MRSRSPAPRFLVFLVSLALISLACGLSQKTPTDTLSVPTPLVVTVVVIATQEQAVAIRGYVVMSSLDYESYC